jgi:hydrogenase/urease accessory protein HupE
MIRKSEAAFRNRVPNVVVLGLFGIAAIAGGFAGYASGLDPKRNRLPVYIVGFLVSAVILLIFDLDRTSSGFIRND